MTISSLQLSSNEVINLFDSVLNSSAIGIVLLDEDFRVKLINSYCNKLLNETEINSTSYFFDYFNQDQKKEINEILLSNSNLINHFEKEFLLKNGIKIWLELWLSKLEFAKDKFFLIFIKDITNKINIEQELNKSKKRYLELFNNANDAVLLNYLNYGKTLSNFIEVNAIACEKLNFTKDEFIKLNPLDIILPENEAQFNSIIETLVLKNHIIFTMDLNTKDKIQIPFEISSHYFDLDDRPAVLSILRDLTERRQTEEKLKISSEKLRLLASHLQTIREEERTTIAREIHDEIGQFLTGLKFQIELLSKKLKYEQIDIKKRLENISSMIDASVETVQKITTKLRPTILDDFGLISAIEWQAKDFSDRTGIEHELIFPQEEININKEKSTAIFRIIQEALTNVSRHSNANKVKINYFKNTHKIIFEISDNGKGITNSQIKSSHSFGIMGMKERALILGGQVIIKSSMNAGTTVKIELPMDNNQA